MKMRMRIIVTGSRNLWPIQEVGQIICNLFLEHPHLNPGDIRIVHGCCPMLHSCDWAFDEIALKLGMEVEQFHPEQYGPWPGCGPKRNEAMVRAGADLGIAYHDNLMGSKGTLGCVKLMLRAGIPVRLYGSPFEDPDQPGFRVAGFQIDGKMILTDI